MPLCDGRSDGPGHHVNCPERRADSTVHLRQGDLMLCEDCNDYRFPSLSASETAKSRRKANAGKKSASVTEPGPSSADPVPVTVAAGKDAPVDVCGDIVSDSNVNAGAKVIVNELLSYACYHRNGCRQPALVSVICGFYTPSEITAAKRSLVELFHDNLKDTVLATERRSSSSRPAHEAELEDVTGMLDLLDTKDLLNTVTFAAVNLGRVPGYAPEETNLCSIIERHAKLDTVVTDLTKRVFTTDQVVTRIESKVDEIHVNMHNRKNSDNMQHGGSGTTTARRDMHARDQNVVVFGVRETSDWWKQLSDVLNFAAGRDVTVQDAFRIGRVVLGKQRPILVKLNNLWDRRLILSNCRHLASCDNYMSNVFINADEALEERRKKTLRRLAKKAVRERKTVETSGDESVLYIDGVVVFSVKEGLVRDNVGTVNDG